MSIDSFELPSNDGDKPGASQSSRLQLSREALFTILFILTPILAVASIVQLALAAKGSKRSPPSADISDLIGMPLFHDEGGLEPDLALLFRQRPDQLGYAQACER
jgi:hypothetical protein